MTSVQIYQADWPGNLDPLVVNALLDFWSRDHRGVYLDLHYEVSKKNWIVRSPRDSKDDVCLCKFGTRSQVQWHALYEFLDSELKTADNTPKTATGACLCLLLMAVVTFLAVLFVYAMRSL